MNKSEPAYVPKPMKIVSKKGTMITADDGKKTITRNQTWFKKISPEIKQTTIPTNVTEEQESYDDDDDDDDGTILNEDINKKDINNHKEQDKGTTNEFERNNGEEV